MKKQTRRALRDTMSLCALKMTFSLLRICPLWVIRVFSVVAGTILYHVSPSLRQLILDNLSTAFPSLDAAQKKKYARHFLVSLIRTPLKALCVARHLRYLDRISIEGKEHLDEALRQGRGVVALTAHLGNFPLMLLKLAQSGYPVHIMQRPIKGEKLHEYIRLLQLNAGITPLYSYPRSEAVRNTITALRENKIVFILMDQDFGTQGVWVRFFGQLASVASGPIVLALRTQAAVLPVYTYVDERGRDRIVIMPSEKLCCDADKEKSILLNAGCFSRIIESWVRKYPQQWGWIHHRWRSQPSPNDFKMGRVAQ